MSPRGKRYRGYIMLLACTITSMVYLITEHLITNQHHGLPVDKAIHVLGLRNANIPSSENPKSDLLDLQRQTFLQLQEQVQELQRQAQETRDQNASKPIKSELDLQREAFLQLQEQVQELQRQAQKTRDQNVSKSIKSYKAFIPPHDQTSQKHNRDETEIKIDGCDGCGQDRKGWLKKFSWTKRIDKHTYSYLSNPKEKCEVRDGGVKKITVLVLVLSALANVERRNIVRTTYMREAATKNVSARIVFLLGTSENHPKDDIAKEAEMYGDIVQEDFHDTYYNLSIKTIMGMKWASEFCSNSDFVMKVDDDAIVNIVKLAADLATALPQFRSNYVAGLRIKNAAIRKPSDKWYIPEDLYPFKNYKGYPHGSGYVVSTDVAAKLYQTSLNSTLFPFEDVFMGMLLHKLEIDILTRDSFLFNFIVNRGNLIKTNCTMLALKKGYITWNLRTNHMLDAWRALQVGHWDSLSGVSKCVEEYVENAKYLP